MWPVVSRVSAAGFSRPCVPHGGGVSRLVGGFPDAGRGSQFLGMVSVVWAGAVVVVRIFPLCLAGWGWGGAGVGGLLFAASGGSARSTLVGRAGAGWAAGRVGVALGLGWRWGWWAAVRGKRLFKIDAGGPSGGGPSGGRPSGGRPSGGRPSGRAVSRPAGQVWVPPGMVSCCSRQAATPQDRRWQGEWRPVGRRLAGWPGGRVAGWSGGQQVAGRAAGRPGGPGWAAGASGLPAVPSSSGQTPG